KAANSPRSGRSGRPSEAPPATVCRNRLRVAFMGWVPSDREVGADSSQLALLVSGTPPLGRAAGIVGPFYPERRPVTRIRLHGPSRRPAAPTALERPPFCPRKSSLRPWHRPRNLHPSSQASLEHASVPQTHRS